MPPLHFRIQPSYQSTFSFFVEHGILQIPFWNGAIGMKRNSFLLIDLILFCILLVLLLIQLSNSLHSEALTCESVFSTRLMNSIETDAFLQSIQLKKVTDRIPHSGIECFDADKNHILLVGFHSSRNAENLVCRIAPNNEMTAQYTFHSLGSYQVECLENGFQIYWIRSDVIASFDFDAHPIEVRRVVSSDETTNHIAYLKSRKKRIGDIIYTCDNAPGILSLFATEASRITQTDIFQKRTVLWEDRTVLYFNALSNMAILIFFSYVFIRIRKKKM